MAPAKRKSDEKSVKAATATTRVTRSSTRQASHGTTKEVAVELPPKTKKAKLAPKAEAKSKAETTEAAPLTPAKSVDGSKTIVIEHCKQCNQFKIRAVKVKDCLEKGVSGIKVLVNPEKPRRGCFEIREEGGEKFISLLDMKRPFAPMKALDMDAVISDIINKIK